MNKQNAIKEIQQNKDVTFMIRPGCMKRWAIYQPLGDNRARNLYESNDSDELRQILKDANVSYV